MLAKVFLLLAFTSVCHGVGSGGPASTAGTGCPAVTSCSRDGSSNYMNRSLLTYSTVTGKFGGSFVSNSCPEFYWSIYSGVVSSQSPTYSATCYSQPVPDTGYASGSFPKAAPLRNTIGFTISGGSAVYGPFEAGFSLGQACSNSKGSCPGGVDVATCEAKLRYECGDAAFTYKMFADDCGGHATPYHFHNDISCTKTNYSGSAITGQHSPLVAIMLDGRGLYGKYESGSTLPTDLDACGGHTGPVPATSITGSSDTYPAAASVYHYHTQPVAPYVPGCFGPVSTLVACKALFTTCTSGTPQTFCTTKGNITYQQDCPCFQNMPTSETFNQVFTSCTNTTNSSTSTGTSTGTNGASVSLPSAVILAGLLLFVKLF